MTHTLKTIEGIEHLLTIEESKSLEQVHKELGEYITQQQLEHPQRDKINIARSYLVIRLSKDYKSIKYISEGFTK
jgi:hypothetical protein